VMMKDDIANLPALEPKSRIRRFIRTIPRLRETLYLLSEIRTLLTYRPGRARVNNARDYEQQPDPWGYSTPWGVAHLQIIREMLVRAVPNYFGRALDVGSGEGWITETIAGRCDYLLGVDIVAVALERAKHRCVAWPQVHFADWDLQRDPAVGTFDLILLTGVLECFRSARELRVAREKIVGMLAPEAHLLITTTHQTEVFDNAWWSRWLPRGSLRIEEFLASHPSLEITHTVSSKTHRLTLYKKKSESVSASSSEWT
jgi:2-polyprenyl-3-methyl-5-hydroxy-6-metoxy-1,4-benzoquinol methylase